MIVALRTLKLLSPHRLCTPITWIPLRSGTLEPLDVVYSVLPSLRDSQKSSTTKNLTSSSLNVEPW